MIKRTAHAGKVGRNDLCPCGSGLNYKRCHGSVVDPKLSGGNSPLNVTFLGTILGGFPGQDSTFPPTLKENVLVTSGAGSADFTVRVLVSSKELA